MEFCITLAILSVFFGIIIGAFFAIVEDDGTPMLLGAGLGIIIALIFILFGCAIGPMECETPDTQIEIESSKDEVTLPTESVNDIEEIIINGNKFVKVEEENND